jgi:hypothetical protein
VCHRTVSGAPGPYRPEPATLGFQKAHSAIMHRTVRCTSRAMAKSRNGRLCKGYSALQCASGVRAEVRGAPDSEQDLSGVAPDCPVPQEDKTSNSQLLPNPNDWVTWRRIGQCPVAHRTVWCAHRQQPSPTAIWWLGAINTPNHHNSKHPSLLKFSFNKRASAITPRHNSKKIKASPSPKLIPTT